MSETFREKKDELLIASKELDEAVSNVSVPVVLHVSEQLETVVPILIPDAISFLPERYEFISVLGEGGMGAVFKVRDLTLDKIFALKMLRPQMMMDADALARFNHEARAARELNHANIASVYDSGFGKHGAPYLVMEYLEGRSLEAILQEEATLSVPRAVGLSLQLADALAYAHAEGIIHRDVKPSNIVVNMMDNGEEILKLVDFGIAKTVVNEGRNFTRTGDVIGSPCYMSPEQCEGPRVGPQADLYSLGCVMYEMLSGKPPFVGSNAVQTVLKHMREKPLPLVNLFKDGGVPEQLDDIVLHCLQKSVLARYRSALELRSDLEAFLIDQNAIPSFKKPQMFKKDSGAEFLHWLTGDASLKESLQALGVVSAMGGLMGIFYLLCFWSSLNIQDEKLMQTSANRTNTAVKQLMNASQKYKKRAAFDQQAQIFSVLTSNGIDPAKVAAEEGSVRRKR